jgi:hypothetical protein
MSDDDDDLPEDAADKMIRAMKEATKDARQGFWCVVPSAVMRKIILDRIHELDAEMEQIKAEALDKPSGVMLLLNFMQTLDMKATVKLQDALGNEKMTELSKALQAIQRDIPFTPYSNHDQQSIKMIQSKMDRLKIYATHVIDKEKYKMTPHDFDALLGGLPMVSVGMVGY